MNKISGSHRPGLLWPVAMRLRLLGKNWNSALPFVPTYCAQPNVKGVSDERGLRSVFKEISLFLFFM